MAQDLGHIWFDGKYVNVPAGGWTFHFSLNGRFVKFVKKVLTSRKSPGRLGDGAYQLVKREAEEFLRQHPEIADGRFQEELPAIKEKSA